VTDEHAKSIFPEAKLYPAEAKEAEAMEMPVKASTWRHRALPCRFLFFMGLCATTAFGHDLAGGTGHHLWHVLFGWLSKPPAIAEGLRQRVRDNVLVCIGATSRQEADDYDIRYRASQNLGKDLSEQELQLLYSFLDGTIGGRDPLGATEILLLKGSVCTSLNWMCGRPPDGFGLKLKDMIAMRALGLEWRRMCIHHLASFYEAKWKNDPKRMSNDERETVEKCLLNLATEKRFAYEALRELNILAKTFSEIEALVAANKAYWFEPEKWKRESRR
jgi:hypothetical protein